MPAYTRVANDPDASVVGTEALHEKKETGGTGATKVYLDPLGLVAEIGRGVTDTDQTYIGLKDPDGVMRYIRIAADNTITASATRP